MSIDDNTDIKNIAEAIAGISMDISKLTAGDIKGDPGNSAYSIWLKTGKTGSIYDMINDLRQGAADQSIYEKWKIIPGNEDKTYGEFITSMTVTMKGDKGDVGISAYQSYLSTTTDIPVLTESQWSDSNRGITGKDGKDGKDGADGSNGKSNYELYLDTVDGVPLDLNAWLVTQTGPEGPEGKSAYQLYVDNYGTLTEVEWLKSLNGENGVSAFEEYKILNNKTGMEYSEWIALLTGKSSYELHLENNSFMSEEEYLASLHGKDGADGASAYELHLASTGGNESLSEYLSSLKGDKGDSYTIKGAKSNYSDIYSVEDPTDGDVWFALDNNIAYSFNSNSTPKWVEVGAIGGLSAYQLYVEGVESGTTPMSKSDWLESLKGDRGDVGPRGARGYVGPIGEKGSGYAVVGALPTEALIKEVTTATVGDIYISDEDGTGYCYQGDTVPIRWVSVGNMRGLSAYLSYVKATEAVNGEVKTEADWIYSLNGRNFTILSYDKTEAEIPDIPNPHPGDTHTAIDTFNTWTWTGSEWINLGPIRGKDGLPGEPGATGATGEEGPQGPKGDIGLTSTQIMGYDITLVAGGV